jgi:hypothetical protein
MESYTIFKGLADQRSFIGGSDIMGDYGAALIRLRREKRGEIEPEDLFDNLIVQLGIVTEYLNRYWSERRKRQTCRMRRRWARWPHSVCLRRLDLRNRTPSPPPFSSMNSMPAASMARCSFKRASSETRGPKLASIRFTVGRDSPARAASSD